MSFTDENEMNFADNLIDSFINEFEMNPEDNFMNQFSQEGEMNFADNLMNAFMDEFDMNPTNNFINPFIDGFEINSADSSIDEFEMNFDESSIDPFIITSLSSSPPNVSSNKHGTSLELHDQNPPKKLKTSTSWTSSFKVAEETPLMVSNNSPTPPSITISFKKADSPQSPNSSDHQDVSILSSISQHGYNILQGTKSNSIPSRRGFQAKEHILSERKRREKLKELFQALWPLIPHPTKMDKASVLANAIDYIKELQERVQTLEGKNKERNSACSSNGKRDEINDEPKKWFVPEIEVKVLGKNSFLVRICGKQQSGFLVKVLNEVEKLHLKIINSDAAQFANDTILITVVVQMDDNLYMTANDIVQNLHSAIITS